MPDQEPEPQSTTPTLEEFRIPVEPLRSKKVYICTPAYGGNVNLNFMCSCLGLQQLLLQCGIPHEFHGMSNESLIPRARNRMVNWFLQTDCTHLLFIDGDIEFEPKDVVALLHFDKEVIGAAYPCKGINWEDIKKAVLANPDIPVEDLDLMGPQWASHLVEGHQEFPKWEPIVVENLANGFMLIARSVFDKLTPLAEEYLTAPNERTKMGMTEKARDFFPSRVMDNEYMSEDYGFCKLWKQAGGKIFLCPWMKLGHLGTYKFRGDLLRVAQLAGVIH